MRSIESSPRDDAVPVTLLTGFLGAGKTTLLNHLLKQPEMADCAVMVNEFGEVGIDHLLLERQDDVVLLNSGCLCCTVRGDLIEALGRLRDRINRGQRITRVLVETTGLADPAPILHTLIGDPLVLGTFWLAGVVTVVDAVNGAATLDRQPESVKQAAVADRLILSKADLAAPDALAILEGRLRGLNPGAPLIRAGNGRVDLGAILGSGPFRPDSKVADVVRWLGEEAHAAHAHSHAHHHDPNRHDARIHSFCLTFDAPLRWNGMGLFLNMLVGTRGDDRGADAALFWMLGSFGGARWAVLLLPVVALLGGGAWMMHRARALDALSLGDEGAHTLGVRVRALRLEMFLASRAHDRDFRVHLGGDRLRRADCPALRALDRGRPNAPETAGRRGNRGRVHRHRGCRVPVRVRPEGASVQCHDDGRRGSVLRRRATPTAECLNNPAATDALRGGLLSGPTGAR